MSNLKKFTASVAVLSIAMSIVSPVAGVNAAVSGNVDAANRLAKAGVIADQSTNATAYRLGDNITRGEMAKVQANLAGITPASTCKGSFKDVSATKPNTWVCGYVEALLDAGMLSANATFRPNDKVTKAEALKMVMSAKKMNVTVAAGADWQVAYVDAGVKAGIVSSFSDFKSSAVRDFVFSSADSVVTATTTTTPAATDCDAMCMLEKMLNGDAKDTTGTDANTTKPTTSTGTTTTPVKDTTVKSTDKALEVTLASATADSRKVSKGASAVNAASFDLTAGDKDVSVSSVTLERTGDSDEDTLSGAVLYVDGNRVSKLKTTFNSDDEVVLTISPSLTIKAGETVTLTAKVNISADADANQEFALKVKAVGASVAATIGSAEGNTMIVGSTTVKTVTVDDNGSVSDVKVGDTDATIAKFSVKADDADTEIKSITLTEASTNEADLDSDLSNYKLLYAGKKVATGEVYGKYVTFNLDSALSLTDGKTASFTVTADINSGVDQVISLTMENSIDTEAVLAKDASPVQVKFNSFTNFGSAEADAGKVAVSKVNPTSDEIQQDTDDVDLGSIKITNNSDSKIELQGFTITGDQTLSNYFEEMSAVINGSTYDLDISGTTAKFSDDVTLSDKTTEIKFIADTIDSITATNNVKLTVNFTNTSFNNTVEDKYITDITPSTVTFNSMSVTTSALKVSTTSLANATVVKGASDVSLINFQVKNKVNKSTIDGVTVSLTNSNTTAVLDKVVSEVSLYKGSISDANLLDTVSVNSNTTTDTFDFDGFDLAVDANVSQTFIVAVSVVDSTEAQSAKITGKVTKVTGEDTNSNSLDQSSLTYTSGKTITVAGAGTLEIDSDAGNTANKNEKTILAGSTTAVYSADVLANDEKIDVETIKYTLNKDISTAISSASLYLGNTLVATTSSSDIVGAVITFDNLDDLIIGTDSTELELRLTTNNYGKDKVLTTVYSDVKVTNIDVTKAKGVDSGDSITKSIVVSNSKVFSVVPAVVTPSVSTSLTSSATPLLQITADAGSNSTLTSTSTPKTVVKTVKLGVNSSSGVTLKLANSNYSSDTVTGVFYTSAGVVTTSENASYVVFTLAANNEISSGSSEKFKVTVTGTNSDSSLTLTVLKDAVTYTIGTDVNTISTNLADEIDMGTRDY